MAVLTRAVLDALWIDGFIPDQDDYIDRADTLTALGAGGEGIVDFFGEKEIFTYTLDLSTLDGGDGNLEIIAPVAGKLMIIHSLKAYMNIVTATTGAAYGQNVDLVALGTQGNTQQQGGGSPNASFGSFELNNAGIGHVVDLDGVSINRAASDLSATNVSQIDGVGTSSLNLVDISGATIAGLTGTFKVQCVISYMDFTF